jgi:aminoacrylate hydrolase
MLVPGLGGVGSYWNPNIPAFAQKYQVVLHDHRGTGQSSRSRIHYNVDQMTDDLLAVMNHLEIEKAHLVGHSTGGAIGQTLAAKHPERLISLVIYASWTKADPFFRRVFEARRALLTASGAAAYVRSTAIFLYPDWWINDNIDRDRVQAEALLTGGLEAAVHTVDILGDTPVLPENHIRAYR